MATFRVSTVITQTRIDLAHLMLRRSAWAISPWLIVGYARELPGWLMTAVTVLLAGGVSAITWIRDGARPVYDLPDDDRYAEYAVTPEHDPEGPIL